MTLDAWLALVLVLAVFASAGAAGFVSARHVARRTLDRLSPPVEDGRPYPHLRRFLVKNAAEVERRVAEARLAKLHRQFTGQTATPPRGRFH
jgi:hypothetical protein